MLVEERSGQVVRANDVRGLRGSALSRARQGTRGATPLRSNRLASRKLCLAAADRVHPQRALVAERRGRITPMSGEGAHTSLEVEKDLATAKNPCITYFVYGFVVWCYVCVSHTFSGASFSGPNSVA